MALKYPPLIFASASGLGIDRKGSRFQILACPPKYSRSDPEINCETKTGSLQKAKSLKPLI